MNQESQSASTGRARETRILWGTLIFLAALLPYIGTTAHSFVELDDIWLVDQNPYIEDISAENIGTILNPVVPEGAGKDDPRYRLGAEYLPVRDLSYLVDVALYGGKEAWGFHLTNVLLHVVASLLCLWLCCLLVPRGPAPLIAAALFAVHPVHVESVAWVASRKDLLSAVFLFGSVILWISLRRREVEGSNRFWIVTLPATALLFALAFFSKYPAVVLPAILFLWEWLDRGDLKRGLIRVAPIAVLAIAFYALARGVALQLESSVAKIDAGGDFNPLLVGLEIFARYTGLLFVPVTLSPMRVIQVNAAGQNSLWMVALGSCALLGLLAIFVWGVRRQKSVAVAVGLLLISLVPFFAVLPIYAERYLYVPVIGVCLLLGIGFSSGLAWLGERLDWENLKGPRIILVLGLIGFFALRVFLQTDKWEDKRSMAELVLQYQPENYTAWNMMGRAWLMPEDQHPEKAIDAFFTSLQHNPAWDEGPDGQPGRLDMNAPDLQKTELIISKINLAQLLFLSGKPEEARGHAADAYLLQPTFSGLPRLMAEIIAELDGADKAVEFLELHLQTVPEDLDAKHALPQFRMMTGGTIKADEEYRAEWEKSGKSGAYAGDVALLYLRYQERELARKWGDRAFTTEEGRGVGLYIRGRLALEDGDVSTGMEQLEASLEAIPKNDPKRAEPLAVLANLAHQGGDFESASKYVREALEANPDHSEVLHTAALIFKDLATNFANQGMQDQAVRLYEQALESCKRATDLAPGQPNYRFSYAALLYMTGDREGALQEWEIVVQLAGATSPLGQSALGNIRKIRGE